MVRKRRGMIWMPGVRVTYLLYYELLLGRGDSGGMS